MMSLAKRLVLLALALPLTAAASKCRCFPGDDCWPSDDVWQQFNSSLGGKLIRTVPIGTPCHDPHYDAEACEALRKTWHDPITHYKTAHSPMQPSFANKSCDPFGDRSEECLIGAYVQYTVNVAAAEDVTKTIQFCREHNIRFVIRNTGHDYVGKSTGPGAVAVWVHNLKAVESVDWTDAHYTGKAIKLGAGAQVSEIMTYAAGQGVTIVTGNCPTIAVAGGYIQGGGHSPLASKYGLAADQTLEFEVIDGKGNYLIANRRENSDLYWALSGGGGGTYGVVLSVTVRTYPDLPTSMAKLQFASAGVSEEVYYNAIAKWHTLLPTLYEAGCSALWGWTEEGMQVAPLTGPGVSADEMEELIAPYLTYLDKQNVQHTHEVYPFEKYSDWYNKTWSVMELAQAGYGQGGSWFIPESVVNDEVLNRAFVDAARKVAKASSLVAFLGFKPSLQAAGDVENAVFPGWRNLAVDFVFGSAWDDSAPLSQMAANMEKTSYELLPLLQKVSPDSGTYFNEATWLDPNWKTNFYGSNYARLLEIKNKYDPDQIFYGITAVGSDLWTQKADGRLCKSSGDQHVKDEL